MSQFGGRQGMREVLRRRMERQAQAEARDAVSLHQKDGRRKRIGQAS